MVKILAPWVAKILNLDEVGLRSAAKRTYSSRLNHYSFHDLTLHVTKER